MTDEEELRALDEIRRQSIALAEEAKARLRSERESNGRFRKGLSGNSKGRPKERKNERAITPRQYRRDVLGVTEELVPVRTGKGVRMVPFHVANLLAIRQKAMQGHGPSQRYIDKLHLQAIEGHMDAQPKFGIVEKVELRLQNAGDLPDWEYDNLNHLREMSRRL